jgi:hypothetical protein
MRCKRIHFFICISIAKPPLSEMIKWGTFERFQIFFGNGVNFIQSRLKKK